MIDLDDAIFDQSMNDDIFSIYSPFENDNIQHNEFLVEEAYNYLHQNTDPSLNAGSEFIHNEGRDVYHPIGEENIYNQHFESSHKLDQISFTGIYSEAEIAHLKEDVSNCQYEVNHLKDEVHHHENLVSLSQDKKSYPDEVADLNEIQSKYNNAVDRLNNAIEKLNNAT
jgi:hypothetical protein